MSETLINVIVVEPGKRPRVEKIGNNLPALQKAVGGDIETHSPYRDSVTLLLREDGKRYKLPVNRILYDTEGNPYDFIVGTFLVVGIKNHDFCSLTDELQERYLQVFSSVPVFCHKCRALKVVGGGQSVECVLGHPIHARFLLPGEPCERPLTYLAFLDAKESLND